MNAQRVFNKTVRHFIKQVEPAYITDSDGKQACAYRSPEGRMCAVGCHIEDSEYDAGMEGLAVTGLVDKDYLPGRLKNNIPLLEALQSVHDDCAYSSSLLLFTKEDLTEVARKFSLNTAVLKEMK